MKTYNEKNVPKDFELTEKEREEYEKFISSSYKPEENKNRIAQDIENLVEYDYVNDSSNNFVDGHNKKRFAMLHNSYFQDYLNAVKDENQKSSYISYLENEDIKRGIYPEYFSALIKKVNYHKFAYNEAVASKIMNFFGVETVFNKCLVEGNNIYILSLDFNKPNQVFFDNTQLDSSYMTINTCGDIRDSLEAIEFKADSLNKKIGYMYGITANVDKEKLKLDHIKTYLVRSLLIGDGDFNSRNVGLIYDYEKNEILSNPNFDLEYAFAMEPDDIHFYKRNLQLIRENYSDIYDEFIKNLNKFNSFNKKTQKFTYEEIIRSEVTDETTIKMFCTDLEENIDHLLSDYFDYIAKKQKQ